jgi:predicted Zn-dependent protease
MVSRGYSTRRGGLPLGRLLIAGAIVVISLISYFGTQSKNPVTQQVQHIDISPDQEIAMGLQAAPEMENEFGGLDPNQSDQQRVQQIGSKIVARSPASDAPYPYAYHLLADTQTVNAFALPGGQIYITRALYDKLQNEGELAGVLGHETGHVVARHSAEQIAKAKLTEGLTGAAVIAACDPTYPDQSCAGSAQMAALVGQLVNMKYSREDETQADFLGVCFMSDAGYNPQDMVGVMQVLESLQNGQEPPEFLSTHPSPANRVQQIQADIQNMDQCPKDELRTGFESRSNKPPSWVTKMGDRAAEQNNEMMAMAANAKKML